MSKLDVRELNSMLLRLKPHVRWTPAEQAPACEQDLFNCGPELKIWTGASDNTIWQDAQVNWHFRAVHDAAHLRTRLNFTPEQEIELGRVQASQIGSDLLAYLFYLEISGQAEYYVKHGHFVANQLQWTLDKIKGAL